MRRAPRLPPPALVALCVAATWMLPAARRIELPLVLRAAGLALAVLGLALNLYPKRFFRRSSTTVNPLHPERSSALVTDGPYRWSRSPMYLGYALALLGWAVWLAQPAGLVGVVVFVAWIDRLQVPAEEAALQSRFGDEYDTWCRRVRRWF